MSDQAHSSSDEPALLHVDGPIATITLNRPAAYNSVNLAIAQKLEKLAMEIEASEDIRVVVIRGEGRAFSAGGDLQTIGAAAEANTVTPVVGELLKHYHAFIEIIRRMPKISVSSVHGSAAGAGMGLAFVTDLCIAADDAKFTPAYAKIGVSPDGGSTVGIVGTVGSHVLGAAGVRLGVGRQGRSGRRIEGSHPAAGRTPGAKPTSGPRGHQGAGLSGAGHAREAAARRGGAPDHHGHEHGRVPCSREEVHQQVEMNCPLLRTDIAGPGRRFEAADRLGKHVARQPQHHAWEIDDERDGRKEHHIDRQCRA
jgi:hypothetical protein